MQAVQWPLFEPSEWDQQLLVALGLSVLLHVLVLALYLPQRHQSRESGGSTLTAVLLRPPSASPARTAVPETSEAPSRVKEKILTREDASASIERQRKEMAHQAPSRRIAGEAKPGEGSAALRAEKSPSGKEAQAELKPGEVNVVYLIRDDGHVGQILWKSLPAMTYPQLERIEAAIRAKKLPGAFSGQVRTVTINVLALLDELEGRKPARDEASATAASD